jgi:prophage antirepressor-like protein
MSNTNKILEDLFEGFIIFRHHPIHIVFDSNTQSIWFNGNEVAHAMGYKGHALLSLVDASNISKLSAININQHAHHHNHHNHHNHHKAPYVNLAGLFSLINSGKHSRATEFKNFILNEVVGAFLKFRIYHRIRHAEHLVHKIAKKIRKLLRNLDNNSDSLERTIQSLTRRHDDLIKELVFLHDALKNKNDL